MKKHTTIWLTLLFLLMTVAAHAATSSAGLPFEDVPRTVFQSISGSFLYFGLLVGALVLLFSLFHGHHGAIGQIIGFLVLAALATHLDQVATVFKWSGALC